jgi:hypothetical protein
MNNIFFGKSQKNCDLKGFFDLNKYFPTDKILTFSRGESIKDELRHNHGPILLLGNKTCIK